MDQLSTEAREPRSRFLDGQEGGDFVQGRICGNRLRVIIGRHLSKHEIERESYMAEFRLSPDQLLAKESRLLHSSHNAYEPYGRTEWVAAFKRVCKNRRQISTRYLQHKHPQI